MANLFNISSLLIGFLTGFLSCELYITYTDFHFKNEVDLSSVGSLIVTTLLAVYVVRKLNKHDEGEKIEKNLLIDYIKIFDSEFTEIMRKICQNNQKYTYVASIMKRYNLRLQNLIKLSKDQNFLKPDSSMCKIFEEKISEIRELLTNTPRVGEIEDGIRLDEDGKLSFSQNQLDKIASGIFDIHSLVFKFVVEINRSNRG